MVMSTSGAASPPSPPCRVPSRHGARDTARCVDAQRHHAEVDEHLHIVRTADQGPCAFPLKVKEVLLVAPRATDLVHV